MSDLPDMQELVRIVCTDSMPMMYVDVKDARKLLDTAKRQHAEIERLREYKARREAEDAAMDIDIDRMMSGLPPLKPGKAGIAMGKIRAALGMEKKPICEVMEAAADQIERLRAHIDSDYREACYLRELVAPQCVSLDTTSGVLSQLSNFMAGQRDDLSECRRLLREICDAIDEAPSWPNPVLSRLGIEWHKSAIVQAAKAAGGE